MVHFNILRDITTKFDHVLSMVLGQILTNHQKGRR